MRTQADGILDYWQQEGARNCFPCRAESELKANRAEMEMAVVRPAQ